MLKQVGFFGRALPLKSKPFGRIANLRIAQDFTTAWVSSHSTGGDEENRTPVRKSIHIGVSERSCFFKFPYAYVKQQTYAFSSS